MHEGNKLEFVQFDKDDSLQIEFMREYLRSLYTRNIVIWQYEKKEFFNGLYFIKQKNNYIASQGMIPLNLCVRGKITASAKSETSFLLPEFRNKGIFQDLYFYTMDKSAENGIQIIWGFTELTNLWRNKLKFDVYEGIINESELLINFTLSQSCIWRSKQSFISKAKLTLKSLYALTKINKFQKPDKEYSVIEMDKNKLTDIDLVVNLYKMWQINNPDFVCIQVNKEFLNWRIFNNPIAKYKLIGILKNEILVCIGIINVTSNKSYLVDFIVPNSADLNDCLCELLLYLKQTNKTSHLIYWASNRNSYSKNIHLFFKTHGAICYVNNSMNFVIKKKNVSTFENLTLSDFYLNGLWTEGFNI